MIHFNQFLRDKWASESYGKVLERARITEQKGAKVKYPDGIDDLVEIADTHVEEFKTFREDHRLTDDSGCLEIVLGLHDVKERSALQHESMRKWVRAILMTGVLPSDYPTFEKELKQFGKSYDMVHEHEELLTATMFLTLGVLVSRGAMPDYRSPYTFSAMINDAAPTAHLKMRHIFGRNDKNQPHYLPVSKRLRPRLLNIFAYVKGRRILEDMDRDGFLSEYVNEYFRGPPPVWCGDSKETEVAKWSYPNESVDPLDCSYVDDLLAFVGHISAKRYDRVLIESCENDAQLHMPAFDRMAPGFKEQSLQMRKQMLRDLRFSDSQYALHELYGRLGKFFCGISYKLLERATIVPDHFAISPVDRCA